MPSSIRPSVSSNASGSADGASALGAPRTASITQDIADIQLGDHLCHFCDHDPTEHLSITLPFIRHGLAHNEWVIYIADDTAVDALSGHLAQSGVDVEREARSGRLKLWTRGEWRQPGPLNSEAKSLQVRRYVEEALLPDFGASGFWLR